MIGSVAYLWTTYPRIQNPRLEKPQRVPRASELCQPVVTRQVAGEASQKTCPASSFASLPYPPERKCMIGRKEANFHFLCCCLNLVHKRRRGRQERREIAFFGALKDQPRRKKPTTSHHKSVSEFSRFMYHWHKVIQIYNASLKLWGPSVSKFRNL